MITKERFMELVCSELNHLHNTLSQEQKDKLDPSKLGAMRYCVYQQIFGSFYNKEAMECKRDFVMGGYDISDMGCLEYYLYYVELQLSEVDFRGVADFICGCIMWGDVKKLYDIDIPEEFLCEFVLQNQK